MRELAAEKSDDRAKGVPEYRIYSAHDYQIANIMV